MSHRITRIFAIALGLAATAVPASLAGVPDPIPFQNMLVDSDGKALGSGPLGESDPRNYDVVFRIHPRSSGAESLWSEQQTVTIDRGLLSVQLGEGLPVQNEPRPPLAEVFKGLGAGERYLSTTIRFSDQSPDFEILPRIRLLGNPRALLSAAARSIADSNGRQLFSILGDSATIEGDLSLAAPLAAPALSGNASALTGLNASAFTTGTIPSQHISTGLDASRINGSLPSARIPASLPADRIGNLDASSITSGTLDPDRLPLSTISVNRSATFTAPVTFQKGFVSNADIILGYGALHLGEPGNEDFGLQIRNLPSADSNVTALWGNSGGILGDKRHGNRTAMEWDENNNVTMRRPLLIAGSIFQDPSSQFLTSFFSDSSGSRTVTESLQTSIDADGLVLASAFHAFSDSRIKMEIVPSDPISDSRSVESLRVVDYAMIDRPAHGDRTRRGFLAQEVEKIQPSAVSKTHAFLPDIMSLAESVVPGADGKTLEITTAEPHGLRKGDTVRLILPDKTAETAVLASTSPSSFTVEHPGGAVDSLFVYGRETSDFHVLESDQVFTATLSAIQSLLAESATLDRDLETLDREIADLESLESEVRRLTARLAAANDLQPAGHRPVSSSAP
jgi:hypothetical protein